TRSLRNDVVARKVEGAWAVLPAVFGRRRELRAGVFGERSRAVRVGEGGEHRVLTRRLWRVAPYTCAGIGEPAAVDGSRLLCFCAQVVGEPAGCIVAVDNSVNGRPPRALPNAGRSPICHSLDE